MPAPPLGEPPFGAFAGFRLTLTAESGSEAVSPVENRLTWVFSELEEGGSYTLKVESVDEAGRVIAGLPAIAITVPVTPTFTRVDNATIEFS